MRRAGAGVGMLSMPYAVMLGGWLSLAALVLAASVFCLSGLLIVRNFEKVPAGMPQTYPALGAPLQARADSRNQAMLLTAPCCVSTPCTCTTQCCHPFNVVLHGMHAIVCAP